MDERTAVYRIFAADDFLLYVGISDDFGRRWTEHERRQPWWPDMKRQTVDWYDTRAEALDVETAAIKAERPKYNKTHAVRTADGPELDIEEELARHYVTLAGFEPGEGGYGISSADIVAPGTYEITFGFDPARPDAVTVTECRLVRGGDLIAEALGGKTRPMAEEVPGEPHGRISREEALAVALTE